MIREYKGYDIKPHKEVPTCYIVVTSGKGGKIPDVLSGLYTTPVVAQAAIDKYLDSKPKKETKDAEAGDTSGG
jgi:hypothetical protein